MADCDFTYSHYKKSLELAKNKGYTFMSLTEFEENKDKEPLIILRHDIDFSPRSALELAKIENQLDIRSTYFVRVHANSYNLIDSYVVFKIFSYKFM